MFHIFLHLNSCNFKNINVLEPMNQLNIYLWLCRFNAFTRKCLAQYRFYGLKNIVYMLNTTNGCMVIQRTVQSGDIQRSAQWSTISVKESGKTVCPVLPLLFNMLTKVTQNVKRIQWTPTSYFSDLGYADDIFLLTQSYQDMVIQ